MLTLEHGRRMNYWPEYNTIPYLSLLTPAVMINLINGPSLNGVSGFIEVAADRKSHGSLTAN